MSPDKEFLWYSKVYGSALETAWVPEVPQVHAPAVVLFSRFVKYYNPGYPVQGGELRMFFLGILHDNRQEVDLVTTNNDGTWHSAVDHSPAIGARVDFMVKRHADYLGIPRWRHPVNTIEERPNES